MKGCLVEQEKEVGLQNERAHWIPDKINFKKAHIGTHSREISEHQGERVPLLSSQFEKACCKQSQERRLALDFSFATLELGDKGRVYRYLRKGNGIQESQTQLAYYS